jgi:4-diphosphocytidyl-2-C-methyl-D-erythritol kinase
MTIAAAIGSDVPFFLIGGSALGLGRGEQLYPLVDRPRRFVVLAAPAFGVATADAYRWLAEDRRRRRARSREHDGARNDLEAPVESRHPAIRSLRHTLASAGADEARMSGSGSAVYGLFRAERLARRAAAGLAAGGVSVWLTRTRPRNQAEKRRLA